jgi:hypothetical protein
MLSTSCSIRPLAAFYHWALGVATQPQVQYTNDFCSNTSGWDRSENDLGGGLSDGKYHLSLTTNTDYFSTLYRNYSDICLQVDAHWWKDL